MCWHGMGWAGMAWHELAQCGMAWHGLPQHGMAGRAMAWAADGMRCRWHGLAQPGMWHEQPVGGMLTPAAGPQLLLPGATLCLPQEYVRTFEPLLLEECAAQMLRGQEEGQVLTSQVCWLGWLQGVWLAGQRAPAPLLAQAQSCALAMTCAPMPALWPPQFGPMQPAVVAAAQTRPDDESLIVRLTMPPGVSSTFHENDMMLVSRDNPEVGCALLCVVGCMHDAM